jgi:hypothetical protein
MKRILHTAIYFCTSCAFIVLLSGTTCANVPTGTTVELNTAFDRTGTIRSDGAFTSMLDATVVQVGDQGDTNLAQRGIISVVFNDKVSATDTITSVILRIKGSAPEGDPFGKFGAMTIDHVNVQSSLNDSFSGKTLTADVGSIQDLTKSAINKDTVDLDVTEAVQQDLAAGRLISSFRFQFANAPAADGTFDQVEISANQNDTANLPIAIVTLAP